MIRSIGAWQTLIHDWAVEKGFWDTRDVDAERVHKTLAHLMRRVMTTSILAESARKGDYGVPELAPNTTPENILTLAKLMLVVSELSEAAEDVLKGDTNHFAEEIADVVIRLFDLAGACNIDLEAEIDRKMEINAARPRKHGKLA